MTMKRCALLILVLFPAGGFLAAADAAPPDQSLLKEGDIIFQESVSEQARAIKRATRSRYTHAGILFTYNGQMRVLEAVQPVKITGLDEFIARGADRHYVIKRLRDRDKALSGKAVDRMRALGKKFLGRNYDPYFEWSDRRIYCTELIWKLYKRAAGVEVGKLQKLREFDLSDTFVRKLMKQRYGGRIPYDEPVISPQAMFEAENLVTVAEDPRP